MGVNSGYIFTMSFLIVLSILGISYFVKFALYLTKREYNKAIFLTKLRNIQFLGANNVIWET